MAKCKLCGVEIIFVNTPRGHAMPCLPGLVNIWRTKSGRQRAVTENGEVVACEFEPVAFVGSEKAYREHWSSCPGAERARRKK